MDDPGGVFASDAHRRVMANVPNPDDEPLTIEALITERINQDAHALAQLDSADDLVAILKDLEADGHVRQTRDGWKNTKEGFAALTGPNAETANEQPGPSLLGLDPGSLSNGKES